MTDEAAGNEGPRSLDVSDPQALVFEQTLRFDQAFRPSNPYSWLADGASEKA